MKINTATKSLDRDFDLSVTFHGLGFRKMQKREIINNKKRRLLSRSDSKSWTEN